MGMILTRTIFAVICLLGAAPGFAQSAYVGAAVGMDVSRFSRVESPGFDALQPGGEAQAFSLRIGTRVGRRWGVELAFTRPSEVERESTVGFPIPLARLAFTSVDPVASISSFFGGSSRLERRDSTLDTLAWMAQPVGNRVDLVYLGGVAFNRTVEEVTFTPGFLERWDLILRDAVPSVILPPIGPSSVRTTTYGITPVVGLDARIELTDHVRLVPGVRMQGIGGGMSGTAGWLIRPSVGLMWEF